MRRRRQQPQQQLRGNQRALRRLNIDNPRSVLQSQNQFNQQAITQSTPNVSSVFGGREVAFGPNGQATVTESLSPQEQAMYAANQGFRNQNNEAFSTALGQAHAQGAFQPGWNDPRQGQQGYSPWQDLRQGNPYQLPSDYAGQRDQVYNSIMDRYNRDANQAQGEQQKYFERRMAEQGIPVGSQAYNSAQEALNKQFDNSRLNMQSQALMDSGQEQSRMFGDTLAGNQNAFNQASVNRQQQFGETYQQNDQAFNQGFNAQGQRFDQAERTYQMPYQIAGQFAPYAGQFYQPNLGPTQQINTQPLDVAGTAGQYFGARLGHDASLRATAAQGNPAELIRLRGEQERAGMSHMAGLNAAQGLYGPGPQRAPSTTGADVAGGFAGGVIQGITNGLTR